MMRASVHTIMASPVQNGNHATPYSIWYELSKIHNKKIKKKYRNTHTKPLLGMNEINVSYLTSLVADGRRLRNIFMSPMDGKLVWRCMFLSIAFRRCAEHTEEKENLLPLINFAFLQHTVLWESSTSGKQHAPNVFRTPRRHRCAGVFVK